MYHVLNRANARLPIFEKPDDYLAFESILAEAKARQNMRLLAFCVMRNHWHLVVWLRNDTDLSEFTGWLTLTHTQRWHAHRKSAGTGHLYQGRFKSFPVQGDDHFYSVCRYAERNALRANLVSEAEAWRWSSLWHHLHGPADDPLRPDPWPVPRPRLWRSHVNQPETEAELAALRRCVKKGAPFGEEAWVQATARKLDLESTLRPRGRPRKPKD